MTAARQAFMAGKTAHRENGALRDRAFMESVILPIWKPSSPSKH